VEQRESPGDVGKDYVEKAIFMNSTIPVIEEFRLDPRRVFVYFNLDLPSRPLITKRLSYPIILDIRTHLGITLMTSPEELGCELSTDEVMGLMFGARGEPGSPGRSAAKEK
jgi:hypothetical protein